MAIDSIFKADQLSDLIARISADLANSKSSNREEYNQTLLDLLQPSSPGGGNGIYGGSGSLSGATIVNGLGNTLNFQSLASVGFSTSAVASIATQILPGITDQAIIRTTVGGPEMLRLSGVGSVLGSISLGATILVTDNTGTGGIRNAADYSADFVDESLVTKRYVDAIAGPTSFPASLAIANNTGGRNIAVDDGDAIGFNNRNASIRFNDDIENFLYLNVTSVDGLFAGTIDTNLRGIKVDSTGQFTIFRDGINPSITLDAQGGTTGTLSHVNLTASHTWNFPNASGTVALTSDLVVPTLAQILSAGNLSGGNDIDMQGSQIILSNEGGDIQGIRNSGGDIEIYSDAYRVLITADSGLEATTGITMTAGGSLINMNNNQIRWFNGNTGDLNTQALTALTNWLLPNKSGVIALTSDIGLPQALSTNNTTGGTNLNIQDDRIIFNDLVDTFMRFNTVDEDIEIINNDGAGVLLQSADGFWLRIRDTFETNFSGILFRADQANTGNLNIPNLTAPHTWNFPDASGDIALTSDIPSEALLFPVGDQSIDLTVGTDKETIRMPFALTLTAIRADVVDASLVSAVEIDIKKNGVSILSTNITIDPGENSSATAAIPAVISDTSLSDLDAISVDIVAIGDVTGPGRGLKITLIGTR